MIFYSKWWYLCWSALNFYIHLHIPDSSISITAEVKVSCSTKDWKLPCTSAIFLFTRLNCWLAVQHHVVVVVVGGPGFVSMPDRTRRILIMLEKANSSLEQRDSRTLPRTTSKVLNSGWAGPHGLRQKCRLLIIPKVVADQSRVKAKNRNRTCSTCKRI